MADSALTDPILCAQATREAAAALVLRLEGQLEAATKPGDVLPLVHALVKARDWHLRLVRDMAKYTAPSEPNAYAPPSLSRARAQAAALQD